MYMYGYLGMEINIMLLYNADYEPRGQISSTPLYAPPKRWNTYQATLKTDFAHCSDIAVQGEPGESSRSPSIA